MLAVDQMLPNAVGLIPGCLIYNRFHNILKLFDVLPKFSFTTCASETMCDYYL